MTRSTDPVALVTGAAQGIGEATTRELARRGTTVVLADVSDELGRAVAEDVSGRYVTLDVSSEGAWPMAIAQVLDEFGRLDVLVNAAGIVGDVANGTFDRVTYDDWRKVLRVNLDGTFLGCRAALAAMKVNGSGAIVNVASVSAYYPSLQHPAYGASKGAVTSLTKTVALYGSQGGTRIRCNSVHPGQIVTPMLDHIKAQYQTRATLTNTAPKQDSVTRIPLGVGRPEDVAALIAFLASDDAHYITGGEYTVDGGWRLLR